MAKTIPWFGSDAKPTLSAHDISDLTFYFRSYESIIGLRSSHVALVNAINDVRVEPTANIDPYAEIVDDISRAKRVYRVLKSIDPFHATVLNLVYGEPSPNAPVEAFAKDQAYLAPLARFTDAADKARLEMVASQVASTTARVQRNAETHSADAEETRKRAHARRLEIEAELAFFKADRAEKAEREDDWAPTDADRAWEASLRAERAKWSAAEREAVARTLATPDAERCVAPVATGIGAEVTALGALRWRLATDDGSFAAEVRVQAKRLHEAACEAYKRGKTA